MLKIISQNQLPLAETLPEFIAHHTVEKLCLPCKLVLPKFSAGSGGVPQVRRKPAGMKQALQTGASEMCVCMCVCVCARVNSFFACNTIIILLCYASKVIVYKTVNALHAV